MLHVNIKINKSIFKNISNEIHSMLNNNSQCNFIGKIKFSNYNLLVNSHFYICKNKILWNEFGKYEKISFNTMQYIPKGYTIFDYTGYIRLVNINNCNFIIELLIKNGKLISYEILSLPSINYNIITKFC